MKQSEKQLRREEWIIANRGRIERETLTSIAMSMVRLSLFSRNTGLAFVRVSIRKSCMRLGLPMKDRDDANR